MDKITVEIKEELEFETIIDEFMLNDIAQFFVDMIIIPYIEDAYTNIIGEALIEKLSNTSYDDINIGMAKAILKYLKKNKIRG